MESNRKYVPNQCKTYKTCKPIITKNSHTLIETQRFLHALTQPLKYSLGPKQNSKIEQCLLF